MKYIFAFMLGLFIQTFPAMAHDQAHKHTSGNNNPFDPREQEEKDPLKEGNDEETEFHSFDRN